MGKLYIVKGNNLKNNFFEVEKELVAENNVVKFGQSRALAMLACGVKASSYNYIAFGSGTPSEFKDPSNPPTSSYIINKYFTSNNNSIKPKLFSEFFRAKKTRSIFIDFDGNYTEEVYPNLSVSWTINVVDALGIIREIGVYSGDASDKLNSGYLVRYMTLNDYKLEDKNFPTDQITFEFKFGF